METRILFLAGRKEWLQENAEPFTKVDVMERAFDTPHLEYEFYEHLFIHRIIKRVVEAEKEGYDAVVIPCFYDPGLKETRELVEIPIVGVCEASLHVASMITAGKFSILVGRRKWIPKMSENARNYGFESKIASWRVLNLTVPEMVDKKKTQEAILRETKRAKEDDLAECVVLGCTGMAGQAAYVQSQLGVPVLDPVLMGLKVAELRANLWKKFKISQSKVGGYEAPKREELRPIYEKAYGSAYPE